MLLILCFYSESKGNILVITVPLHVLKDYTNNSVTAKKEEAHIERTQLKQKKGLRLRERRCKLNTEQSGSTTQQSTVAGRSQTESLLNQNKPNSICPQLWLT